MFLLLCRFVFDTHYMMKGEQIAKRLILRR
jgi:hypothetical protein